MPGVLQVEAMAQAGGLMVLNSVEEPERWSTYFLRLDNVKFRKKVVPGDTLIFRVELIAPIRHGISTMHGFAFCWGNHCDGSHLYRANSEKQITEERPTRQGVVLFL